MKKILSFFDRLFDWAYSSKYSPLYKSGTLASGLLFFIIITGFYLLFFYKLSSPFESVQNIQNHIWLGSLVRSLHRYASDLTVVVVAFHILRMMVERKTWGPRFLAWVSGVILLAILFLSGWTGYVMVWDRHGQKLAIVGAGFIDSLGLLVEPISRAFNGVTPVLGSFFFMNLFLHVAIPLGMILILWIHTFKLARAKWFPEKKTIIATLVALSVLSILSPAPLANAPNLFRISGAEPTDWFFNFWMYFDSLMSTGYLFSVIVLFFLFMMSIPFWLRPKDDNAPIKSTHDETKCEGCNQCAWDCPYDAIAMVPRTLGTGSDMVANVKKELCVGCGICAGSCSQLAIGPLDRSAKVQLEKIQQLRKNHKKTEGLEKSGVAVIYCEQNFEPTFLQNWVSKNNVNIDFCAFACSGSIHPAVVQTLLLSYQGVFALSCPPLNCKSREGTEIFQARIFGGQSPSHPDKLPAEKIQYLSGSIAELPHIQGQLENFYFKVTGIKIKKASTKNNVKAKAAKAVAFTSLMLFGLSFFTRKQMGQEKENSFVRLSWKMPRQIIKHCRKLSEAEVAKLPMHMRRLEECQVVSVPYKVDLQVDQKNVLVKTIQPKGARHDRPMYIDELIAVEPGLHSIKLSFYPSNKTQTEENLIKFDYSFTNEFTKSHAQVVSWDGLIGPYLKK